MNHIVRNMLLFLLLTLGLMCDRAWAELEVFASFEEQGEIQSIRSSSGVRISPSTRFPAWEGNSLEVIAPEGGGSIEISKMPPDWRWQESLLVFVWSQQSSDVALILQDSGGANYRQSFRVRPGANHLQVRLAEARTLKLQAMRSLTVAVTAKGTFYFDYFALDRFHPILQQRGRWDINYSMDVETPHVPWARPLAGGPIKVFAIADVADGRGDCRAGSTFGSRLQGDHDWQRRRHQQVGLRGLLRAARRRRGILDEPLQPGAHIHRG